jgi:predicted nucleic acid-binding protein
MNLVDSSCWLEYFADSPGAERYYRAVKDTSNLLVPSITIYEVHKRALQTRGQQVAFADTAYMHQGLVVDLDAEIAVASAVISHELKLPLADSVILATARMFDAILWTQDEHFKGMDGVKYFEKSKAR